VTVAGLRQALLEKPTVELQPAERVVQVVSNLGSDPAERREGSASQARELPGVLDGDRGLSGEALDRLEVGVVERLTVDAVVFSARRETFVVVTTAGVTLDKGEGADPLATVSIRTLFTALCYLTAGSPAMPRDSLDSLATEATSALAAQINRLAPD